MENQSLYLSVIIPVYNEEDRLPKTLSHILEYLQTQTYLWEIIVVSSRSTDDTVAVARRQLEGISNSLVLELTDNKGKGYAVAQGMLAAHGAIRLFTDADNSTDISHFDKIKPLFDAGHDVVIGSREPKDAVGATQAVPQSKFKRLLGDMGNLVIRIVAVRGIRDTQCGFKAFTNIAAERIFSQLKILKWGFDIEVLAMARRFGYKIGIIPVYWVNDPKSHVRLSAYFEVLFETFKIRFNLLKGIYK